MPLACRRGLLGSCTQSPSARNRYSYVPCDSCTVVRQMPSGPFVIGIGSQSLNTPATATLFRSGASKLNITDFFAGEMMRLGGRRDGVASAPRSLPCPRLVDLAGDGRRDLSAGLCRVLPPEEGFVVDRPGPGRREDGLGLVPRVVPGVRRGELLLIIVILHPNYNPAGQSAMTIRLQFVGKLIKQGRRESSEANGRRCRPPVRQS